MKLALSILLVNLFFVLIFSEENFYKPLKDQEMAKYERAFKNLRKYMRYLESDSESEESDSESADTTQANDSSNSTVQDTIAENTVPGVEKKTVKIMKYNSFYYSNPTSNLYAMSFKVFIYFLNTEFYPKLFLNLGVTQHSLRELDEKGIARAECSIDSNNIKDGIAPYECTASSSYRPDHVEVDTSNGYEFEDSSQKRVNLNSNSGEIEVSEAVLNEEENLNSQSSTASSFVIYGINNIEYSSDGKQFILTGKLSGDNKGQVASENSIPFTFYQEGTNTKVTVTCQSVNKDVDNYQLRCVPPYNMKAKISDATAQVGSTLVSLTPYDNVEDGVTIRGFNSNTYYKKSSSGLSGGAIAGIVIACAVVLILVTILTMYLRRAKPPMNNNSSIVGLRSVDNYQK